jgi:hypothetical protein
MKNVRLFGVCYVRSSDGETNHFKHDSSTVMRCRYSWIAVETESKRNSVPNFAFLSVICDEVFVKLECWIEKLDHMIITYFLLEAGN